MRAHKFGQKWEIGQKSPALTGLRKTETAIPIKPFSPSRNQRFWEDLGPITANARGGAIRESRRTRGLRLLPGPFHKRAAGSPVRASSKRLYSASGVFPTQRPLPFGAFFVGTTRGPRHKSDSAQIAGLLNQEAM